MIKVTNLGMMVNGNNVENEAELTMLLNAFFSKSKEVHGEERAFELMTTIGELAVKGFESPLFVGHVDIDISVIGGMRMEGCEPDMVQALGAVTGALYKGHIEHRGEDEAKEWLAFIGRLATMSDEELAKGAEEIRSRLQ